MYWNAHYIRPSHHETVSGVPDVLYAIPEEFEAVDCAMKVVANKLLEIEQTCVGEVKKIYFKNTFITRWTFKGCSFLLIMNKH